ncbi:MULTISPECIES: glycosyltransferase family 4 protein [unclassified Sphingomonas]|uniref:glycosyltransferase family 4 protein n=1 Tax=unclassified Sphingomonas TaxID=196159 RepID=UPI0006FDD54D|nr:MULTISPECIES: glycosyltransferase family 4 protein [unclassified Sphingomonas]KQX25540.1 glycosyl transferase family 1 [Sphingomonas sp. Root1294]KQY66530.1 glycosyl transferase family 1 [Sphingomonas sp. Root50]KRB90148.1 glycosyl transferase family 1 [Sphingomonas sp. Root720]
MKLAYLLNSYPMTSTTFIRREIAAIERAGVPVKRFAVRHWSERLVDPQDMSERGRTEYLLTGNGAGLVRGLAAHAVRHPRGFGEALETLGALRRAAAGGVVRHTAYLAQAIRLRQRCAALGITRVHAHFSTNAAAVAMLCRLLGGPRYSFTVHGPDELEALAANSLTEKTLHADHVVAISDYCAARLRAHLPETLWERIRVIPCGLDLRDYPPTPPPPSMSVRLLSVGRLCPQKAQVEIPAAIAAAAGDHPGLSVVLIGDGESRAAIEREISATGTGGRIKLLGWRSNAEVRRRIRETRALLLPSHAEGLPIAIMEAFALGRPVITTRIAGIPELVDETCGWLVEAGDGAALAAAIGAAMDAGKTELARMGREGRKRIVARHDIDGIAPQLIALFAAGD